jgi:hypothetical protein
MKTRQVACARATVLLAGWLVAAGCGSGSGSGQGGKDVGSAADAATDLSSLDPGGEPDAAGSDAPAETVWNIEYPEPADPVPTPTSGTYGWTDGKNTISFAINDGKVFLLESSFSCVGDTGCKVIDEFTKLTCNKAYEKGYVVDIVDGVFLLQGIKGSDSLYGALQAADTVALVYELTPGVACCKAKFPFDAAWALKEDCADWANPDCDPFTDEFCTVGFNCIFGAGDKPVCRVAGDVEAGGKCATQGNCKDGVCMALQGDDGQHCYKYCKTMADCGGGKDCMPLEGAPYKVCALSQTEYEKCNLLSQNCKEAGQACYYSSSPISSPVCMQAGEGVAGDPCAMSGDCAKGLDCIANKECMKICDTGGGAPECESTFTSCPAYYAPQSAGYCDE